MNRFEIAAQLARTFPDRYASGGGRTGTGRYYTTIEFDQLACDTDAFVAALSPQPTESPIEAINPDRPTCRWGRTYGPKADPDGACCGSLVMVDRHGYYESLCEMHLVMDLRDQLNRTGEYEGKDKTGPEDSEATEEPEGMAVFVAAADRLPALKMRQSSISGAAEAVCTGCDKLVEACHCRPGDYENGRPVPKGHVFIVPLSHRADTFVVGGIKHSDRWLRTPTPNCADE